MKKITLLPIDFVSKALVALSLHHPDKSHVYHLKDPQGMMWVDLITWLNKYGYAIKLISEKEWQAKLLTISVKNPLYPLLAFFLSPHTSSRDAEMQQTIRALEQLNISYPRVDDGLLKKYFDYLRSVGFLPDPT